MAIAPYGDRRCSSHLSHRSGQMYEDKHYTASPSPQFACPQRGRKRLSREATLHTELALEWPDLVQIGRCKVQWPPRTANKRFLTSFCSKKTIYTTKPRIITPAHKKMAVLRSCTSQTILSNSARDRDSAADSPTQPSIKKHPLLVQPIG